VDHPLETTTMSRVDEDAAATRPTPSQPASSSPEHTPRAHINWPASALVEQALLRHEGVLSATGALAVQTGKYTGRSPKDKFIVREPSSEAFIDWGVVNQPFDAEAFDSLERRVRAHLARRETWRVDAFGGTDPTLRLPIRVEAERAYHALFSRQMFVEPLPQELAEHKPEWTILAAPDFHADPARDGTRSEAFVILHFGKKIVLIGGTLYAGEIKKSVFSILNYELPRRDVLSMHCSANVGEHSDVALFFGLSGTGKTTLSADPTRRLIGDDEHAWSDDGVFNIEGGCYAKCIKLSRVEEPAIYNAIRFGAVLENVILDPDTRQPDFNDDRLTENTRAAYPIHHIPNHVFTGRAGHPRQVVFLTCDAFGVLPPVSRLTPEQAMYHFLSGYTAKVAGTERDMGSEPQAVFSTCYGAPFLPMRPAVYADLLGAKLREHRAQAWLINTGWTGGGYGVGKRISLPHTRSLIDAIMAGVLREVPSRDDPIFGVEVPRECPGVPSRLLDPRSSWPDPSRYDTQARLLAGLFHENFQRFDGVSQAIRDAGPRVTG
jgi:phosphoenolpyruvate carboxykinase (ATP)